jgi:membrane-associated phospholipid phosphatase
MSHPSRSRIALVGLLLVALPGRGAVAQSVPTLAPDPVTAAADGPEVRWQREIVVSGLGAGLLVAGHFISVDRAFVSSAGLDPSGIVWSVDRDVIGRASRDDDRASTWTRNASLVLPLALAVIGSSREGWRDLGARGLVYAETLAASQGLTVIGKNAISRARPYAYLAEGDRPDDPSFDVLADRTFASMPSGHSSSAWTGASMGMMEHLLSRPQATGVERAAVGFLAGGLAGTTSALRVEAGQHFPSDVIVGAGIGVLTGVSVPLLHRGRRPLPSSGASLEMLAGALVGTLTGVLLAR